MTVQSDIKPEQYSPAALAKKCINVPNRYKYMNYVEIDVTDLDVIQGREGVLVIPNNSSIYNDNKIKQKNQDIEAQVTAYDEENMWLILT